MYIQQLYLLCFRIFYFFLLFSDKKSIIALILIQTHKNHAAMQCFHLSIFMLGQHFIFLNRSEVFELK